jgi:hypothetical protein
MAPNWAQTSGKMNEFCRPDGHGGADTGMFGPLKSPQSGAEMPRKAL